MNTITYKGIISLCDERSEIYLSDIDDPLIEIIDEKIKGKYVNVRYFICDKEEKKALLIEGLIHKLYGDADTNFYRHYSEYTGYLWTDEDLKIGGHDLASEIKSNEGKFLYLEIGII